MSRGSQLRRVAGGRHLDRRHEVSFSFDGEPLTGYVGDTVASALLANGKRLVARSYKYHRPRGILGSGAEEPNAYVRVGEGANATPNQRATETMLTEGMQLSSQNRFPSLRFDVGEVNAYLSRFLPAGFYYKTFIHPRFAWKRIYEPLIRQAAGMGRAPEGPDPDSYEQMYCSTEVLVIGGGPAGLSAARAAAAAGVRVMLVEQSPWFGGRLLGDPTEINGMAGADWAAAEARELANMESVRVLPATQAAALYDHNYALLYQRPSGSGAPRRRLWRVRADRVVLATGAIERPLVFAENDRPGIMLASAVRDYVERWAVAPGTAAVIFTCQDNAYLTALALRKAGVEVRRIVDTRRAPDGPLVAEARAQGIEISPGSAIVTTQGRRGVQSVQIAPMRDTGRPSSQLERIDCDLVAVSGGWSPAAHLYCHAGGKLRWDGGRAAYVPDPAAPPLTPEGKSAVIPAGSANGFWSTAEVLSNGIAAGKRAVEELGTGVLAQPDLTVTEPEESTAGNIWFVPGSDEAATGKRHFVDYQHDVTVADLELAVREGYDSAELAKRYTTLGMAPDQGKVSNVPGYAILADAIGRPLDSESTTTIRPPYTPITLGAIAGASTGDLFRAVRETPPYDWHVANNADFEPVGDWRRPYRYQHGAESRAQSVNREILAVRSGVGIVDASTLGKLVVSGPDAGRFLDLIYTNMMSTLGVGRCRYGLMCTDAGFLFDDGVVVRFDEETFLCHTTSGGAERVHAWLEEWLQTEWFDLQVYLVNVTEQWAQVAVAGPNSRKLLQNLSDAIDFGDDALPPLGMVEGNIRGTPARVFRISFSGELAYEVAVPAGYGASFWDALLRAGQAYGLVVYGTEALHVMRAEKGYIMIGDETDGTVTPLDLGLSWAVSKKKEDFLGKRGMRTPHLASDRREELVGLLTEDPQTVLPDGACAVEAGGDAQKRIIGHVTSTYHSPTLNRSIAMALIERGRSRHGEVLEFSVTDSKSPAIRARIVEPMFLSTVQGGSSG